MRKAGGTRLIIVDPSLQRSGGHNLDYDRQLLRQASHESRQVTLVTHRGLPRSLADSLQWPVLRLFRDSLYRQWNWPPTAGPGIVGRLGAVLADAWNRRCAQRRRRRFIADCGRLVRTVPLQDADTVFLPMLSLAQLDALLSFLQRHDATRAQTWLVQLHYAPQAQAADRGIDPRDIQRRLDRLPQHRIHCFATTASLAARYRNAGLHGVVDLPYPVDPKLTPVTSMKPPPFCLVIAGHLRREKGRDQLRTLLRALWPASGNGPDVGVLLQGNRSRIRTLLPPDLQRRMKRHSPGLSPAGGTLAVAEHPLSTQAYRQHIRQAHIGLMLYDPQAYRVRCSGVLSEFLSAGIPVVVPAGSWLSEQLAEAQYHHHRMLLEGPLALPWVELSPTRSTNSLAVEAELPAQCGELLLLLNGQGDRLPGTPVELTLEWLGTDPEPAAVQLILSPGAGDDLSALLRPPASATGLCLRRTSPRLGHRDLRMFALTGKHGPALPLGAVGLAATDPVHAADCLREITAHYEHYRASAREFSRHWRARHSPQALLAALDRASQPVSSPRDNILA